MPDCGPLEVSDFVLRANYPNVYSRMADARWPAPAEELPGYRPARVEYRLNGSDQAEQIPVRGVDIPILNNRDRKLGKRYLFAPGAVAPGRFFGSGRGEPHLEDPAGGQSALLRPAGPRRKRPRDSPFHLQGFFV